MSSGLEKVIQNSLRFAGGLLQINSDGSLTSSTPTAAALTDGTGYGFTTGAGGSGGTNKGGDFTVTLNTGVSTGRNGQLRIAGSDVNFSYSISPVIPSSPNASGNIVFVASQFPTTLQNGIDAYVYHVRGWGQGSSTAAGQSVLRVHMPIINTAPYNSVYTGSQLAAAGNFETDSQSSGASAISFLGNAGVVALSGGVSAGWNFGVLGRAQNSSTNNFGVVGVATAADAGAWNVGILGIGRNTGAAGISTCGYFYASAADNTLATPTVSSIVTLDGGGTGFPLLVGINNSVQQFSLSFRGTFNITATATGGGVNTFNITPGAHTGVAAEINDYLYASHTITVNTTLTTQRFTLYGIPTISVNSGQTVTNAANVAIAGAPIAAGVGVVTNLYALWSQGGINRFDGDIFTIGTATTMITGFIYIPSNSGPPTGVPSNVTTTSTPLYYDHTNNFLYAYNGGWKKSTVYA